jgi:hypothetical protein
MQYVWYPQIFSPAADTIIKIGKPVTEKIIPLLTDTTKGLIAHFILAHIWADTTKDKPHLASSVYPINNDPDIFLGIRFADFTFYRQNSNRNIVKEGDLDKNKKRWIDFLASGIYKTL